MLRLARLLMLLLPLLALLAAGNGFARTGNGLHNCEGMVAGMTMDDCMRGQRGSAPECPPSNCLAPQSFLPPESNLLPKIVIQLTTARLPHNEADLSGLSWRPDLRPPIA